MELSIETNTKIGFGKCPPFFAKILLAIACTIGPFHVRGCSLLTSLPAATLAEKNVLRLMAALQKNSCNCIRIDANAPRPVWQLALLPGSRRSALYFRGEGASGNK